jgi:hypothetical protein
MKPINKNSINNIKRNKMAIQQSSNSFSTITNIRFGSNTLKDFWWNVKALTLPTISLTPPEINTRAGANVALSSDTAVYTDLGIEIIMDKDWEMFDMIYSYFLEGLNVDTGKFSHFKKFELWAEFVDGEGNVVKKFNFHSCSVIDFTPPPVDLTDQDDTIHTMDITFNIMYYTVDNLKYINNTEDNSLDTLTKVL